LETFPFSLAGYDRYPAKFATTREILALKVPSLAYWFDSASSEVEIQTDSVENSLDWKLFVDPGSARERSLVGAASAHPPQVNGAALHHHPH
jgi:hypothetical protein